MNREGKTRHSQRVKKMQQGIGKASLARREALFVEKVDLLESDEYETPEKLAEEKEEDRSGRKKVRVKNKKEQQLRKKFNLKKLIRDNRYAEQDQPNFATVKAEGSRLPCRKACLVCGLPGKGRCSNCYDSFCSLRCYTLHKQVRCE
ncbi:zinc finger HIT domain-containing protein 1-like [Hippocampus zosterae]|uniref:zinc finger HIT domain-containing protein 1-like n=1 Tax=Hippocampus zosterae TaxID=109293 RepID=UPI00223D2373|nr:zinc finger HIT domain-containing protein 1-like [Hippocampus zosterae]